MLRPSVSTASVSLSFCAFKYTVELKKYSENYNKEGRKIATNKRSDLFIQIRSMVTLNKNSCLKNIDGAF